MREKVKEIPEKFKVFWDKYTSKQKTIVIAIICVVLIAIGVVAWLASRPTWSKFQVFDSVDDANTMTKALDDQSITWKASSDGKTIYVHQDDMTNALYAMSDNGLTDKGYTWDAAFDNSMSTTESEKDQKRVLALQSEIRQSLIQYKFIDDANVFINVPETTYTVLSSDDAETAKTSITASIELNDKNKDLLDDKTAETLAYWLANTVGTDVKNVIINDTDGKCIYNGNTSDGLGGVLTGGSTEYCNKLRNTIADNVTTLLIRCGYDDAQVGTDGIQFDMNKIETLTKEYSVDDGREYGYPTNLYTYSSKGASGNGGTPGTDSNDSDTDYVNNSSSGTSNTVDVQKLTDLLTNEKVQNIKQETPAIKLADSSLGIVVRKYTVYKEDDLKADGTLDKTTWDQFISQNNKISTTTVSTDEINLISAATGVSANKITVLAYNVPQFVSSTKSSNGISNYLMIILTVLIIALLIFVILRGASPLAAEDEEPELSVEQLLATTKENQSLDDIEFSDKSETRKMIEKFVDENPEAVAQLLRNWLNDEWE
ncbi:MULTISPECIES: hypothetical protein [Clostridia]|jgi:flagellar M-ring protein FliF|uniref:Flagellar M-ring N-terminal domain-containing protein n=1 Tax=Butyribacter intestini TaxID=1703332 RepID=A0AAW3JV12_9FIRM|nr:MULTISPECIES: hypothetical protein [Clostridia]KQC86717.1 hypothetical protein APZ18_06010 [Butyribacter intestini]RHP27496.1 hypothetical protein DWZ63_02715 [Clostridium sp. AF34-13]RHU77823.1 hypothetical protein DXC30_06090 [Butyribacter intestini]UYJ39917.1 MAG: hypothetical protein OGM15_09905 [Lachnospiraceae bacterium]